MNSKGKLVIGISDYDNRWNKVAVEIAREHLNPTARNKQKKVLATDQNHCDKSPTKALGR